MKVGFTLIVPESRFYKNQEEELALLLLTLLAMGHYSPIETRWVRPTGWTQDHCRRQIRQILGKEPGRFAPGWPLRQIRRLYTALTAWAHGAPAKYSWTEYDTTYPVDNGLTVKGNTLTVWVAGSGVSLARTAERTFRVEASGSRHSFAANHTGRIAEALMGFRGGEVSDLTRESQAQNACDNEPGRLFKPTLTSEVKHKLGLGEWDGLLGRVHDPRVRRAAEALLRAIDARKNPKPPKASGTNVPNDDFVEVQEN